MCLMTGFSKEEPMAKSVALEGQDRVSWGEVLGCGSYKLL